MRTVFLLITLVGCTREADDTGKPGKKDTDKTGTTDTDTTLVDTDDTGWPTTTTTTTTTPTFDCAAIPAPSSIMEIDIYTEEDFDFDLQGYLMYQSNEDLVGRNQYGDLDVISPKISSDAAGIQLLSNGDVAVASPDTGTIKYVDRDTGVNHPLIAGLSFPNGVESGEDGILYFSEMNGDRVRWINVTTLEDGTISSNVKQPNNLSFGPGEQTLYVTTSKNYTDYAIVGIDRNGDGWDPPRVVAQSAEIINAVETDVCGNLYTVEFSTGKVIRIDPVTGTPTPLGDIDGFGSYSSMRWGNGIGGWDPETLYITNRSKIYAIDVGVPGNPDPLDP